MEQKPTVRPDQHLPDKGTYRSVLQYTVSGKSSEFGTMTCLGESPLPNGHIGIKLPSWTTVLRVSHMLIKTANYDNLYLTPVNFGLRIGRYLSK